MWNLSRSKAELLVEEVWLGVLEGLFIGVGLVVGNVFEVFIVEAIQDWLVAVWVVDHLQVDHWRLLGAITREFPLWLELLPDLDTRPGAWLHWLMNAPLSCVVVFVLYELRSIRAWRSWHHCSPHNGCWLMNDLTVLALIL